MQEETHQWLMTIAPAITGLVVTLGVILQQISARMAKKDRESVKREVITATNRFNAISQKIDDVHERVDGGLEHQINRAKIEARHTLIPQILVVDDSVGDRAATVKTLMEAKCQVFEAWDWEGVNQFIQSRIGSRRGEPFDFILLSIRMPNDGALTILSMLDNTCPLVPVVILTAYSGSVIFQEICGKRGRFVITKPLTPGHIKDLFNVFGMAHIEEDASI